MATPFTTVYKSFLSNVTDYNLANLPEASPEKNTLLWLKSAISYCTHSVKKVNDYDEYFGEFNQNLDNNEIQVLAKLMVEEYMNTYLFREDLLSQSLNSKDYRAYSPANQLKALRELKAHIHNDANVLMSRSSYSIQNLEAIRKKLKGDRYEI
jgi:hypothetical protein